MILMQVLQILKSRIPVPPGLLLPRTPIQPEECKRTCPQSDSKKKDIDVSLVKMITTDYQPLSVVENSGFLEYTEKLNPLYEVPSRKALTSKLLPELYDEVKTKVTGMLDKVDNVAITTDMWSSESNESYLTVTCHFIYDDELHASVLATKEIYEAHTGRNIATAIQSVFDEWKIDEKIVTVVSDNGANMKNAVNEHLHKYHHPCVAHTLNLSVNEAINKNDRFKNLLTKCRNIVRYFKHSDFACRKLKELQEQMGLPVLKIKQDVTTRWNSTLVMIERLLKIKDPLTVTLVHLPKAPASLEAEEWDILSDCVSILKPFELMTVDLSGEKYPTMSLIIPLVRGLQYTIRHKATQTDTGNLLQHTLLDVVARRLGTFETNKMAAKATFLDPRLKKVAFGLEVNANTAQKYIAEELTHELQTQNPIQESEEMFNSASPVSVVSKEKEENCLWAFFDEKIAKRKTTITPATTGTLILKQYLELPYLQRSKNPLEFWKKHKNIFPELYKMQLKYLCIPGTSVPSERVFSKTGQLTSARRNRLSSKNLDKIVFLNSYFT